MRATPAVRSSSCGFCMTAIGHTFAFRKRERLDIELQLGVNEIFACACRDAWS
ncbi:hypothetical protein [Mesorhizobium sp. A623]